MARYHHLDRVHALADKALALGGTRLSAFRTRWDISGNCANPYTTELYGRPDRPKGDYGFVVGRKSRDATPQLLEIITRCRRCEPCLRTRQRRWYGAAKAEMAVATRTWWGTLTIDPEHRFRYQVQAEHRSESRGVQWTSLSPSEQYVATRWKRAGR